MMSIVTKIHLTSLFTMMSIVKPLRYITVDKYIDSPMFILHLNALFSKEICHYNLR